MITLTGIVTGVYPDKQINKETGEVKHFVSIEIISKEGGKGALRKIKADLQNLAQWEKFMMHEVSVADMRMWFGDKKDGGLFLADPKQLPVLVS